MDRKKTLLLFLSLIIHSSISFSQDTTTSTSNMFNLSLEDLMNVSVVSSTKTKQYIMKTSSRVIVINEHTIQERGYHDLMDLLRSLPFFQIQSEYGHWTKGGIVNFKGHRSGDSGNNKLLVMVDGIRLNDDAGEGLYMGLNSIPLNSVKQVEIVYGPNSTIYGRDAFAGLVNIISKTEEHANAGYSFGTYGTTKIFGSISHVFDKDIRGSINFNSYQSMEQDADRHSDAYKLRTTFPRHPYTEKFYRASDNKYVGIKFLYKDFNVSYNVFNIRGSETYGSNPNLYVTEYSTAIALKNQVFSVGYDRIYSPLFDISASYYYKKYEFDPQTANLYTQDLNRKLNDPLYAYGGRKYYYFRTISNKYSLNNNAKIFEGLQNISGIDFYDMRGIPVVSEGKGGKPITTKEQRSKYEHNIKNFGFYSEFSYEFNPALRISLGARGDIYSLHDNTVMPRFAINYNSNYNFFRFVLSRGFISPSVTQSYFESITNFSWIKKNENLLSEKNLSLQFDWNYLSPDFRADLELFYNKLDDAIVESVTTGDSTWVTIGNNQYYVPILMSKNNSKGNRYGFQISGEKNISDYFSLNIHYSLLLGEDEMLGETIPINKNLTSNHVVNLGFSFNYNILSLYSEIQWKSGNSIKSNHTEGKYSELLDKEGYLNFDPVFLTNINLRINQLLMGLVFNVRIKNVFNVKYYGQTINAQWGSPVILQDLRRIDAGLEYEI
ncbi:MAG: TonB-dependent receptor [Bacteroidetes bacterium]|nr:TonB-dependent receptor [Bacteroidota bacterium]